MVVYLLWKHLFMNISSSCHFSWKLTEKSYILHFLKIRQELTNEGIWTDKALSKKIHWPEAQLIDLRSAVEGNFVREAKDYASRTKFPSTEDRKWTVFQLNQCSWPSSQCIFFAWGKSLFSTRSHQYTPLVSPHSPYDCNQKTSHLEKDYKMKALPCFVSSHKKRIIMNFY